MGMTIWKYDWTIKMRKNPIKAVDDMDICPCPLNCGGDCWRALYIRNLHPRQVPKIAIKVDFMGKMTRT